MRITLFWQCLILLSDHLFEVKDLLRVLLFKQERLQYKSSYIMKKFSSFLNNVGKILSQISIRYFNDFRPKIFEYLHILNFAVIV